MFQGFCYRLNKQLALIRLGGVKFVGIVERYKLMISYISRLLLGVLIGALSLWCGEAFVTRMLVVMSLPGWILSTGIMIMLILFGGLFFRCSWEELAEGDIRNFLPIILKQCVSTSGVFIGLGLFAGGHWIITQSGYGHGVFMLSIVISFAIGVLAYGLYDLNERLVETA